MSAVDHPGVVFAYRGAKFKLIHKHLRMALPSGRNLWYRDAHIEYGPAPWDPEKLIPQLRFYGENQGGGWGLQSAYGGSLTNNFVQGMCRDILAEAMLAAEAAGFTLILTVHDELVAEIDDPGTDALRDEAVERLEELMCRVPAWAPGFPLAADGFWSEFYHK